MTLILSNHRYIRPGEWAKILGIVTVDIGRGMVRDCYQVQFPDGATDQWPIVDRAAGYEFKEENMPIERMVQYITPNDIGKHVKFNYPTLGIIQGELTSLWGSSVGVELQIGDDMTPWVLPYGNLVTITGKDKPADGKR